MTLRWAIWLQQSLHKRLHTVETFDPEANEKFHGIPNGAILMRTARFDRKVLVHKFQNTPPFTRTSLTLNLLLLQPLKCTEQIQFWLLLSPLLHKLQHQRRIFASVWELRDFVPKIWQTSAASNWERHIYLLPTAIGPMPGGSVT
jgi:hypothetical protein